MMRVVITGDCRAVLEPMAAGTFDAVVTDPPYGLGFMGKDWDGVVPGPEHWAAMLRVAKPGAHLVAFGGPRTAHRLACAIEDAGWQIRDSLAWLFGQGFPKSLNVSKAIDAHRLAGGSRPEDLRRVAMGEDYEPSGRGRANYDHGAGSAMNGATGGEVLTEDGAEWDGYGTALKPSYEPIILARKPLNGTVAENVLKHGCGALNVDGCRVGSSKEIPGGKPRRAAQGAALGDLSRDDGMGGGWDPNVGRWPANVILGCACEAEHDPGCAVALLDAQSGDRCGTHGIKSGQFRKGNEVYGDFAKHERKPVAADAFGGASRFFYVAKATRAERERWLREEDECGRTNTHPTVKPVSLMRWLVRLVGGPRGGRILDPFCGSGTTGVACALEGYDFTGIDLVEGHCELARARIVGAHEEAGTLEATAERSELSAPGPVQLGLLLGTEGA